MKKKYIGSVIIGLLLVVFAFIGINKYTHRPLYATTGKVYKVYNKNIDIYGHVDSEAQFHTYWIFGTGENDGKFVETKYKKNAQYAAKNERSFAKFYKKCKKSTSLNFAYKYKIKNNIFGGRMLLIDNHLKKWSKFEKTNKGFKIVPKWKKGTPTDQYFATELHNFN